MSYFTFENKRVYYEEAGDGTPLLLLHGNTASSAMFHELAAAYRPHFRVILIDFLGHGRSDRLPQFPADLWFYEAQQVIAFLREKDYDKVNIIGSSGGALVAINVALEAPELVGRLIADSFEGEVPLKAFTEDLKQGRALSKRDENARRFYAYMHGDDWEPVVDNDTDAILRHEREIGAFFHRPLSELQAEVLFTGSREDEFVRAISPDYYAETFGAMLNKIGHGACHILATGGHPAMLTNAQDFVTLSLDFLQKA